jgi:predicted SprT family Zn-dependent metalloprotease
MCRETKGENIHLPQTAQDWAELTTSPLGLRDQDRDYTSERLRRAAIHHTKRVVELTDVTVDHSLIEWKPHYSLKNAHGKHHIRGDGSLITLSLHSLASNGWVEMLQTVRHELIHAWQHQHDRWDDGTNQWERCHGSSFEEWMDVLSVQKRGGDVGVNAKYLIRCPDCRAEWKRHRECKATRQTQQGQNWCGSCGESRTKGRLELYENGVI